MITYSELTEVSVAALTSINKLLPQLSAKASKLTLNDLQDLADSESTRIFLASDDSSQIIGMLSLIVMRIPTGKKAWIEDVVVDEGARGMGVGKSLMNHAKENAKNLGVKSVDLTSRPSRVDANRLYKSLGYQIRETNVYRYSIS
ncbi:MAG: GNAT family N-acetyltransferase [Verrucomicrobia bacterium TMED56]|jgi:ribosomal protein S18 acetylase RimI-like enzyme|nr:MAG: GNAT family N-acetyltransferase [Verrucomicrobia bacterium TMED56]|tara:strand:- start:165 stop:599 length:435 start_codon:yes stop_codon:yes gene_type:complete